MLGFALNSHAFFRRALNADLGDATRLLHMGQLPLAPHAGLTLMLHVHVSLVRVPRTFLVPVDPMVTT